MPQCFTPAQELYLERFLHFGNKTYLHLFLVTSLDWQELLAKEPRFHSGMQGNRHLVVGDVPLGQRAPEEFLVDPEQ